MDDAKRCFALDPRRGDGRTTLTASGADPTTALGAALAGLLAASRQDADELPSADDATTALPLRAEAADLADLFVRLAASLREDIDHNAYSVLEIRIDGMRRTDDGLRGWGYALAVAGDSGRLIPVVEDVEVVADTDKVTIRALLRR